MGFPECPIILATTCLFVLDRHQHQLYVESGVNAIFNRFFANPIDFPGVTLGVPPFTRSAVFSTASGAFVVGGVRDIVV